MAKTSLRTHTAVARLPGVSKTIELKQQINGQPKMY